MYPAPQLAVGVLSLNIDGDLNIIKTTKNRKAAYYSASTVMSILEHAYEIYL